MSGETPHDPRVEDLKERLDHELVDDEGHAVDPDEVDAIVDESAASYADAPLQEFTPLLIEHDAREALRVHGFHPDAHRTDDDAPVLDQADDGDDDESLEARLSRQQGIVLPDLE